MTSASSICSLDKLQHRLNQYPRPRTPPQLNLQPALDKLQHRLNQYPFLEGVLGLKWLADEYARPFEKWSLITGWLNLFEPWCQDWLRGLDHALRILKGLADDQWQIVRKKVTAHCDRTQFKSVLAELSIYSALFNRGCQLRFEQSLLENSELDVDTTAILPATGEVVHVEVYQLNPSEKFQRELEVSGIYNEVTPIDFPAEMKRIRGRIWRKAKKFSDNQLCLVAIDCTLYPEMGGRRFSPIDEVMGGGYQLVRMDSGKTVLSKSRGPGGLWERSEMRRILSGVLTFQIDAATLEPIQCHATLGEFDAHTTRQALVQFLSGFCESVSLYTAPEPPPIDRTS